MLITGSTHGTLPCSQPCCYINMGHLKAQLLYVPYGFCVCPRCTIRPDNRVLVSNLLHFYVTPAASACHYSYLHRTGYMHCSKLPVSQLKPVAVCQATIQLEQTGWRKHHWCHWCGRPAVCILQTAVLQHRISGSCTVGSLSSPLAESK